MFVLEVVWALGLAMFVLVLEEKRFPTEEIYSWTCVNEISEAIDRRENKAVDLHRVCWAGGKVRIENERPWDFLLGERKKHVALVQYLRPEFYMRCLFMLILVTNCFLLVYAMTVPIVELDYMGLEGSIQSFPIKRYNLVNIGTNIRSVSSVESSEFLAFFFLFVNVFVPVLCSIVVVYVWFIKFHPITLIRMGGVLGIV